MDIHQLQCVLAVASYRNFTVAAENCYISQSSLSQQISNLEKELGVALFIRTTRAVQVSEAGEAFIEKAAQIIREMDQLGQTMSLYSGLLKGTLNIGAITALEKIGFSNLIADFYSQYPSLTLNIYQGKSVSLLESLEKRSIDVAFLAEPLTGDFSNIRFTLLGEDRYDVILSEKHPLARRDVLDLTELKDDRFILHLADQSVSGHCLGACKAAGFTPQVTCRVGATSIALSLVRAGLGIAFLPAEEIGYFHMDGVRQIRLSTPILKKIVMATPAKGQPPQLVSTFLKFVENWMRGNADAPAPDPGKKPRR